MSLKKEDDSLELRDGPSNICVMKFGGTSVGNARAIEGVVQILKRYQSELPVVAVISAMSGITNRLVAICEAMQRGDTNLTLRELRAIFDTHMTATTEVRLSPLARMEVQGQLRERFQDLRRDSLHGDLRLAEERDRILSYGERLSARIVAQRLSDLGIDSRAIDANRLIETDDSFGEARPNFRTTVGRSREVLAPLLKDRTLPVVTGFIGSTPDGRITTLGRGGSDYTASILGRVLGAREVWIWTDVDGIYDADPRKDPNAQVIPEMSFDLADQMAKAGAKVLYTKTIEPLRGTKTILWVKNTFKPNFPGTKILEIE